MKKCIKYIKVNHNIIKDSIIISSTIVGFIATLCTIIGLSLKDVFEFKEMSIWLSPLIRALIVLLFMLLITIIMIIIKRHIYGKEISLRVGNNHVIITHGDLFSENALRLIPIDTHCDTHVDDIIISRTSLHGQFVEEHCNKDSLEKNKEMKAKELGLTKEDEVYNFPLGTVITYENSTEKSIYLLMVLSRLNEKHEAHTTIAEYETTLMRMWKELNNIYNGRRITLPLLGNGILRFDDNSKEAYQLLKCMLCTLYISKCQFDTNIRIVLKEKKNLSLYELREVFKEIKSL